MEENERTILKVKLFPYLHQKDVRERLGTGPSQPVTGVLINDHYNHNQSNNTMFEKVRDFTHLLLKIKMTFMFGIESQFSRVIRVKEIQTQIFDLVIKIHLAPSASDLPPTSTIY